MPRTTSSPMFRSVIWSWVVIGPIVIEFPNGITEIAVIANTTAMIGEAIYNVLYTYGCVRSSLKMNLTPSASGCNRPKGPTFVGPQRFWIRADTLRSSQTLYATAVSRTKITAADLMIEMIAKVTMLNEVPVISVVVLCVARAPSPACRCSLTLSPQQLLP